MRCNFVSRLSLLSLRSSLTLKKDSLSNNKKFVEFVIISFILTTVIIDPRVVMKGEIRCPSLAGVKGLNERLGALRKSQS